MVASPETPNVFTDFINVLVLVGLRAGPVNRAVSRLAIDTSPDGAMVNVFNDLGRLPRYREALETHGTPDAVVDLRLAATEPDAMLVVTSYRGRQRCLVASRDGHPWRFGTPGHRVTDSADSARSGQEARRRSARR
jgi:hypothetical protein